MRRLRDPTHGTGIDFYTNLWGWLTWSPCKIMQAYTIGMCAYIYIYIYVWAGADCEAPWGSVLRPIELKVASAYVSAVPYKYILK